MNKNVQSTNCDKLGGETRWQVIGNGKNLLLHWYHQPCTVWTVPTSFFLLNCDEYLHRTHSCITRRYIWYIQDTRYFIFQIMAPGGHDTTFIISTYTKNKVKYNNYFITINHVCHRLEQRDIQVNTKHYMYM